MRVKEFNFIFRWFLLAIFLTFFLHSAAQQEKPENNGTVREYAEVVNVEVIVRAWQDGRPLGGLQKSDFTLYEEGEPREITSFLEIRRKIGADEPGIETKESTPEPGLKRLFLLYFWISGPRYPYQQALDYFFQRVYKPGDYVLLVLRKQVFKIGRRDDIAQVLPVFKEKLAEEEKWATAEGERFIRDLEELFKTFALKFIDNARKGLVQTKLLEDFEMRYRLIWDEYKLKRMTANVDNLKKLADSLKDLEMEKWGVVFYQSDTFPRFDTESLMLDNPQSMTDLQRVKEIVNTFAREMRQPPTAASGLNDIQQAFLRANTTFHLMLSESSVPIQYESPYLKMDHVHSDWRGAFDSLSRATGGEVVTGKDFDKLLIQAVEKEDIYYRLTYAPPKADGEAKQVKIVTPGRDLKLLYNRRVPAAGADEIKIDQVSVSPPNLEFTLRHYRQLFDGSRLTGDIKVKVTAVDKEGKLANYFKTFEPETESLTVAMKMNFSTEGKYTLIVEALDRHSGKSVMASQKVAIARVAQPAAEAKPGVETSGIPESGGEEKTAEPGQERQLKQILQRAARYCEKLKRATFYFTCSEEVRDISVREKKLIYENVYLYDYQIIRDKKGKMTERRIPRTKDLAGEPLRAEWTFTNFFSNYSYLMPVDLLARENQDKYYYAIEAQEKLKDWQTIRISVDPRDGYKGTLNHGTIWVVPKDGSIVKIELNPRSIKGIDTLLKKAEAKKAELKLIDIHWYEVQKVGIRFPSLTEMSQVYLGKSTGPGLPPTELESAKTLFSFKDYLFFRVNVDVQHR